jgi:hypothetical protein
MNRVPRFKAMDGLNQLAGRFCGDRAVHFSLTDPS